MGETAAEVATVVSPWSGEVVGEVALAGPGEWEAAIGAAAAGRGGLKKNVQPGAPGDAGRPGGRGQGRQEELAQTIMAEGGKPITYARAEMAGG